MTPDANDEFPPLTPEQKARVLAHFRKQFTPEKLIEYIENTDEKFPSDDVLADADALEAAYAAVHKKGE